MQRIRAGTNPKDLHTLAMQVSWYSADTIQQLSQKPDFNQSAPTKHSWNAYFSILMLPCHPKIPAETHFCIMVQSVFFLVFNCENSVYTRKSALFEYPPSQFAVSHHICQPDNCDLQSKRLDPKINLTFNPGQ